MLPKKIPSSCALLLVMLWPALSHAQDLFESKIRPILATQCYACHTDSALGGLRLDSRDSMLKGGQSGPAIVAGDPEKSLLIVAVRQIGDLKMPMGGKLKPDEVDALTEWIRAGATWPEVNRAALAAGKTDAVSAERRAFWSFKPLHSTELPAVKNAAWAKTPIDRFILARLEKEGLTPVAAADRRTLIRRATLDLTGLPPTPEEIDAFEKDKSPDAFAKVVDRLLDSPHYGERWGRLWLDVARFGEDDYRSLDPMGRGYAPYENAFVYRDWIVRAFNNDLPYDQFVKAQLAADLMDEKDRVRMLPGLGFLGQGPWFYDNGAVEITRADERHDRIDVVSRGFLGMTVGCARCHDHKYDPISQKDYYGLSGVFASTKYVEYPQVPQSVVNEYKTAHKKLENRESLLSEFMAEEGKRLSESLAFQISKYMQAAWRITGEPKEEMTKVVESNKLDYELMQRYITFLARPPRHYPYLKSWQEMIARGGKANEAKKLADEFQALVLDVFFERKEINDENEIIIAKSLPGTKKKTKRMKPDEFVTNDDFCPGCNIETKAMSIDRTNLWIEVFQRDLDEPNLPGAGSTSKPGLLLFRGWGLERQLSADRRAYLAALREEIDSIKKSMPPVYPYVHGVADLPTPVDMPISLRGSPYNLGDVVPRGFLTVLSEGDRLRFTHGSGRLELAQAIVTQPITMRVIVNRIWKWHFGTGIVDTPSNFGMTGERPVHPELLEYLADQFLHNGMSIKKLHREIMLSAVYQLSSEFVQINNDKDSGNRLYWRANRRRMDAEQIRDSLLSVSASLDGKLGGPSEPLTPQYTRRTIYGKVSRYKLDDYLQLFDFPSGSLSAEQRFTTNVPLQRLFFMNSDFVQQQAELLARRVESKPNTAARIQEAYRIVLGRAATPEEVQIGMDYLTNEPMRQYEDRKKAESEKAKDGDKKDKAESSVASPQVESKSDMPAMDPDGMMAGVVPRKTGEEEKKPLLPVTPLGRYMKVLLSSNEFVFIN
jgi:hypothetical protein